MPPLNLNRFDLVSLRLFVAVADAGSLTAGAERIGISLAAASKRIAELEAHIGAPLLARSKRGIVADARRRRRCSATRSRSSRGSSSSPS